MSDSKKPAAQRRAAGAATGQDPESRMAASRVSTLLLRDAYRHEREYVTRRAVLCMGATLAASLAANAYILLNPPQSRYIPVDSNNRVRGLAPLDEELAETDVSDFVAVAVPQALTFSFVNYRAELGRAQDNFTPQGFRDFMAELQSSGDINSVIENKFVATAVPLGAPELVVKGLAQPRGYNGKLFVWRYRMPIQWSLQGAGSSDGGTTKPLTVTVLVVRRPQTENQRGLGINSMVFQ